MDADYIAGDKGLRQLVEGCIVEIQGLKGAPQHNGVQGKLLKYDREKERWGVRLPDGQVLCSAHALRVFSLLPPAPTPCRPSH